MSLFVEEVEINNEKTEIKIIVSCEKRKLATEEKMVYTGEVLKLIPEQFKDKVKLISSPVKKVSNLNFLDHTNIGLWIFEIREKRESEKKDEEKPKRTTRSRRSNSRARKQQK
tara:strand:- start:108 stop:446 length:339 start_codon:yes stop_codon:yes gene_type:complete